LTNTKAAMDIYCCTGEPPGQKWQTFTHCLLLLMLQTYGFSLSETWFEFEAKIVCHEPLLHDMLALSSVRYKPVMMMMMMINTARSSSCILHTYLSGNYRQWTRTHV